MTRFPLFGRVQISESVMENADGYHVHPRGDGPEDHAGRHGSSRRTFLRRLAGGLAIGIPAFRTLAGQSPANAQTRPASEASAQPTSGPFACTGSCPGPCAEVYIVEDGCGCGGYEPPFYVDGTGPVVQKCSCTFTRYSVNYRGVNCGSFTQDVGYCR
jgi:hypothetical protein